MRKIFKYPLPDVGRGPHAVAMPAGSEILSAQAQQDQVCVWAEVNPGTEEKTRYFELAMTGGLVPERVIRFLGTCQFDGGAFVVHCYEVARPPEQRLERTVAEAVAVN